MPATVYSIDDGPPYVLYRADLATGETTGQLKLKTGPRNLALSVKEKHLAIAMVDGTLIIATESFDQVIHLPTGASGSGTQKQAPQSKRFKGSGSIPWRSHQMARPLPRAILTNQ